MNAPKAQSGPRPLKFNEGKACDAVIRALEACHGPRSEMRSPEKERHPIPIDLSCRLGGRLFAFEHTGIEPFEGHVELTAQAYLTDEPIKQALEGRLSSDDFFELSLPADVFAGLRRRERNRIQEAVVAYIISEAATLPRAHWGSNAPSIRKVQPEGVPFRISLQRWERPPGFEHVFSITHVVADVEEQRSTRIRRACDDKFEKLTEFKQETGAKTVLILENNDIFLSNTNLIFDAFTKAEIDFIDRPDEVHLVTSATDETWWVHRLRTERLDYYKLSHFDCCTAQFHSSELQDLTQICSKK